jgi:hypothetical protein
VAPATSAATAIENSLRDFIEKPLCCLSRHETGLGLWPQEEFCPHGSEIVHCTFGAQIHVTLP